MLYLDVCGENEDRRRRDLLANHPRRLEPFRCVARRHPDVDDHELGLVLADELDQLGGVPALAHDLEVGTLEQARQTLAEEDVVVGHDHAGRARGHSADYGLP